MKLPRLAVIVIVSIAAAHASQAQTPAFPAGGTRVALINAAAFYDDKVGITKLVKAYDQLDIEFKPDQDSLKATAARIETLAKEIQQLQNQLNANGPPIDRNALQNSIMAKTEEGERLQIEFKRKQEDAKAKFEKREKIVTDPIKKEISDALEAFRKKNNIDLILDGNKMLDSIMGFNDAINITEAFIKEFNAKAAAVPVK